MSPGRASSVMPELLERGRKAAGGNFNGLHRAGDDSLKERRAFVGKDDFGVHHAACSLAQEIRIPEDQERLSVFPGYRAALEVAKRRSVSRRHLDGQHIGFRKGRCVNTPEGGERHNDGDHDADNDFCGGGHAEDGILNRTSTSGTEAVRRQRC